MTLSRADVQGNCNIITTAPFFGGPNSVTSCVFGCAFCDYKSLCTSETCLRHRRLLTCTTNVQSWKIFTSIKTLLPAHRSLRSLKLPAQLMFWFSSCYCVSGIIHFRHRVIRFTANEITWYKFPPLSFFFNRHFVPQSPFGRRPSVTLRATFRAPAKIWLAVIENGEQQSRSGSDKKWRNRLQ